MLKILIKKQYTEIFRGYFVNQKTGKARSKGGIIGMFVLFAAIMLLLGGMFAGMGVALKGLLYTDFSWMYFSVTGTVAILLGTFGSVFNTYNMLYLSKDNDLLLSMPIPPRTLLLSRISAVYGLSILYGGIVWVPSLLIYAFSGAANAVGIIFSVLLTFILTAFVTVITCALGFLLALISSKLKNKSIISVIITLAFLIVYYGIFFNSEKLIGNFVTNPESYANGIRRGVNFLYQLGSAAVGNILSMLIFTGVTAVLCALCFYLLSKTFIKLATTKKSGAVKKTETAKQVVSHNVGKTLFLRELKRFTGSSVYMLNCGLGAVLMPVVAVVFLVKRPALQNGLAMLSADASFDASIIGIFPVLAVAIITAMLSISCITTPSVSLEGSSLWLLKSLPVKAQEILYAKLKLHLSVVAVPAVVSVILIGYCFGADISTLAFSGGFVYMFAYFIGIVGLMLGLKNPRFDWTNETVVIKQSMSVLFLMLIGLGVTLLFAGILVALRNTVNAGEYIAFAFAAMTAVTVYLRKILMTKGAKAFEEL